VGGELGERVESEGHIGGEVESDLGKPGFGEGERDAVADVEGQIGVVDVDGLGEDEDGAIGVAMDGGLAEVFFSGPDVAEVAAAGEEDGGIGPRVGDEAGAGDAEEVFEGAEGGDRDGPGGW
jgi:hypothetical protein